MDDTMDVIERCLMHWFPDTPPSRRRDAARSIVAALTVVDRQQSPAEQQACLIDEVHSKGRMT